MKAASTFLDPLTGVTYPVVERVPALFSFSHWLIRRQVPGAWRFRDALMGRGIFDVVVRYIIQGSERITPILVPLYRDETSRTAREINEYDLYIARQLRTVLEDSTEGWRLIDCGADIGIVATVFLRECRQIDDVIAFEPNLRAVELLARTFEEINMPHAVHAKAVGAACGFGELVTPETDDSPHAAYFDTRTDGSVPIVSLDSLAIGPDKPVILKIDVEGGELDVIRGAQALLENVPGFVIIFEAHPEVMARTGIEAGEVIQAINAISPVRTVVTEYPDIPYDPHVPLAAHPQMREQICNLMCISEKGFS